MSLSNTIDVRGDAPVFVDFIERDFAGRFYDNRIYRVVDCAFRNCTELTAIDLPNATSVGTDAFTECTKLAEADLPMAAAIKGRAFYSCTSLAAVRFPEASSIGTEAFAECVRLESIYILASSVCVGGANMFASTPIATSALLGHYGSIFVPASLVDAYKSATNWAVYADRITAYVEP